MGGQEGGGKQEGVMDMCAEGRYDRAASLPQHRAAFAHTGLMHPPPVPWLPTCGCGVAVDCEDGVRPAGLDVELVAANL